MRPEEDPIDTLFLHNLHGVKWFAALVLLYLCVI